MAQFIIYLNLFIVLKNRSLELRFLFLFLKHALTKPKLYFPNPLHCSPLSAERAVNMNAKATGGHGIGSPCKSPSRVQRVRSAIRDDGAAGIGAKSGQGEHCSTPIWRENKDVRSGLWPKPGMV